MKTFNPVIQKHVQPLGILPNIAGFFFSGVTKDDNIIRCHVILTPEKTHFIADGAGIPVYSQLKGWFNQ